MANFRVREKCPACLVVICPNRRVARWAERALNAIDRDVAWTYARYLTLSLEGNAQREWGRRMAMMTYPYQGEYAERLHAEGEAKSVLWVLEGRGVPVPEGARERVMGCRDMALFDAWLLRAIEVASADEFFG